MVRQAHHDGHPELVEGKKQRWKILMRNLGSITNPANMTPNRRIIYGN
jgi:hypothetical protein